MLIIDAVANDLSFTRQSKMLHTLYIRGRHNMISTITTTQHFSALHPSIRIAATESSMYTLRNMNELDTIIYELSAVLDKNSYLNV